jgi:hypothetical protein
VPLSDRPIWQVPSRRPVTGDWVFFLDNEDWFNTWARRWGESALQALARNYA